MKKICFLTIALSFFLSSSVMAELKCDRLPNGDATNCVWIDGYRDPMTVITTPPASPTVLKKQRQAEFEEALQREVDHRMFTENISSAQAIEDILAGRPRRK
jgi:hypothetical protein|nr:MAG TPA: hypothetical protein [Caudoviricetes sp.]